MLLLVVAQLCGTVEGARAEISASRLRRVNELQRVDVINEIHSVLFCSVLLAWFRLRDGTCRYGGTLSCSRWFHLMGEVSQYIHTVHKFIAIRSALNSHRFDSRTLIILPHNLVAYIRPSESDAPMPLGSQFRTTLNPCVKCILARSGLWTFRR